MHLLAKKMQHQMIRLNLGRNQAPRNRLYATFRMIVVDEFERIRFYSLFSLEYRQLHLSLVKKIQQSKIFH